MDTNVGNTFYVHNRYDGSYMKYTRCPRTNLYTYVVGEEKENKVLLHATVEDNEERFSTIDQTRAKAVREMQEVLASPSNYDLANAIENNVVGSTPFTRRDVQIASIIHGADVAGMKGKLVKKPSKMKNPDKVRDISQHIVKNYSKVSLYIDAMHVNSIMFLLGISRHIGLIQCVCIRKKNRVKFLEAILIMLREYRLRRVFEVISIGGDNAFDAIKSELKDEPYNVTLDTCDANRHVEVVERMICFTKERIRAVRVAMPYDYLPIRMTIAMVHRVVILMNSILCKGSLHSILSPQEIVTGRKFRCPNVCIGQFGQGIIGGTNDTDKE